MDDDVVIKAEGVYKDFILPHEKIGSVKGIFTSMLRDHSRKMEKQHALKDINFEVKKGEFFGIVGRNGSGKSTLLKMLASIYQPTKGSIKVKGKLVPFIELGVGFNPELSGRDNVYLNGAMLGFSVKEVEAMYKEIVEFAELERFMDQKLKNYSSGMQVRLAFSMAVRSEADILLIDEVLAVGDADFQRKCYEYFNQIKKAKKTVVFVSHDMSAVREYCDRVMLIEKNVQVDLGPPKKITEQYNRLFLEESQKEEAEEETEESKRWGNGYVKIKSVELNKKMLTDKDEKLIVTVVLEAFHDNDDLLNGLRISNSAGQVLHETNTWSENIDIPKLEVGKTCTVVWECPNIYSDGWYDLDLYANGRGHLVFDSWNGAAKFQVKLTRRSGFIVSPKPKITIKS